MLNTLETEERLLTGTPVHRPPNRRPKVLVAVAGIVVAGLLFVLGAVMADNASFSKNYVSRQLSEQRITFKSANALTAEERTRPCLVEYAGQPLTTGKQAECYANSFIGVHLKGVAEGKTFSELREAENGLRAQLAEAQAKSDPKAADLQRQLNELTGKRTALFQGESNRGMLLTAYGFDTLGQKAGQASSVAYGAGAAVLVVSLLFLGYVLVKRPA